MVEFGQHGSQKPLFSPSGSVEALSDSGGPRFAGVDSKLKHTTGATLHEHMERSDPAKTHTYLLDMVDRRVKAKKNWENKEKSLKDRQIGQRASLSQGKGAAQAEGKVGSEGCPGFSSSSSRQEEAKGEGQAAGEVISPEILRLVEQRTFHVNSMSFVGDSMQPSEEYLLARTMKSIQKIDSAQKNP